ncbi:unnamed protein product [Nesidiocoris tenuis]|uniref:Uncharacterized protein n=1 Tax=Nesidiocoris tenuis TaxID=355587 RepID=A0A6H5GJU0_9HEMI|nr:unnamed protein product [Nesidiocoris tenuis]
MGKALLRPGSTTTLEAPHFAKEDEPVTPIIRAKKFTELRPRQDRTGIGIESGFMLWGAHRQCTSSNPSLTYFNPSMHPPLRSAVNAANGFDWQFFPHRRSSSSICRTESCYTYLYYIEMKMVLIVKGAISDTRWTESHGTGHPNHVYPDAMVATGQSQLRRFQRHSINRNQGFTAGPRIQLITRASSPRKLFWGRAFHKSSADAEDWKEMINLLTPPMKFGNVLSKYLSIFPEPQLEQDEKFY